MERGQDRNPPQGVGPLWGSHRRDWAISASISVTREKLRVRETVLGNTDCTTKKDRVTA